MSEGKIDPREYGFGVIPNTISAGEAIQGAAQLYRDARARTGMIIPQLEHLLTVQPFNADPAQALLERYEDMKYPLACTFGDAHLEVDEGVFAQR